MDLPLYKRPIFWVLILFIFISTLVIYIYKPSTFQNISSKFAGKPRPGSCLILEEKYCKNFKLIPNPNDPKGILAVFKIPEGSNLFAPIGGFYSSTPTFFFKDTESNKDRTYPGAAIAVGRESNSKSITAIYGFVFFSQAQKFSSSAIKKGDIISEISDKPIDYFGSYNLVFAITKQNFRNGKIEFLSNDNKLKEILKTR